MLQTQLDSWKPRSFQEQGVRLGVSQACLGLLMKPGLGKTSVIYMIFKVLKKAGFVRRMLVVCPLRPAYVVWPHQKDKYAQFADLKVNLLHGKDKEARLKEEADIYVINPEGLEWLFDAHVEGNKVMFGPERVKFIKKHFDMLVVDESTKFKNPQSGRFKLLKKFIPFFKRRYIMTGTPAPKGLMDLFGQIYILDEGHSLGSYITHYRNQFFFPSGYGGYDWQPQPDAQERITEAISPLVLFVDNDVLDLPSIIYDDIFIELPNNVRKQYDLMEDDMVARLSEGSIVAANAAVASSKCRQICNGAIYDENGDYAPLHREKYDALADLIEQLQGEQLLVTYEFEFDKEFLTTKMKIPCISTGSPKKDQQTIDLFRKGLLPVVCGHPQSISLGIDGLQENCHHLAMVGCTWRLEDYLQVIDRVRRQGSKSDFVIVHRILANKTVDQRVLKVLDQRGVTQESFMQALTRN